MNEVYGKLGRRKKMGTRKRMMVEIALILLGIVLAIMYFGLDYQGTTERLGQYAIGIFTIVSVTSAGILEFESRTSPQKR
jgi:uncharacterized membrane protein HdeD (DUF308 family)